VDERGSEKLITLLLIADFFGKVVAILSRRINPILIN